MGYVKSLLVFLTVASAAFFSQTGWADEHGKVRVISDWKEDEQPIRVDCSNIGIVGDGFGGEQLTCSDRLSLYALFNCFPMKKCAIEATCPEWEGLEYDIDWNRVAELIDEKVE